MSIECAALVSQLIISDIVNTNSGGLKHHGALASNEIGGLGDSNDDAADPAREDQAGAAGLA